MELIEETETNRGPSHEDAERATAKATDSGARRHVVRLPERKANDAAFSEPLPSPSGEGQGGGLNI
jgi:hypothetical protein